MSAQPVAPIDEPAIPGRPPRSPGCDPALPPDHSVLDGSWPAPPRNAIEELLVRIWTQVLGVEPIGIHDSFYDLGGDSLRATQIAARSQEVCGVELPLKTFFDAPTIAGLASHLAAGRAVWAAPPATARSGAPAAQPLPLSSCE